jgi:hypothetical protein
MPNKELSVADSKANANAQYIREENAGTTALPADEQPMPKRFLQRQTWIFWGPLSGDEKLQRQIPNRPTRARDADVYVNVSPGEVQREANLPGARFPYCSAIGRPARW